MLADGAGKGGVGSENAAKKHFGRGGTQIDAEKFVFQSALIRGHLLQREEPCGGTPSGE